MTENRIGEPVLREEDLRLLSGRGRYTDDVNVLHQARGNEEIFPIEIDLDVVRHQRETGKNGLGQVLKSFRDRNVDFDVYANGAFDHSYQNSLGPLRMPERDQGATKKPNTAGLSVITGTAANDK